MEATLPAVLAKLKLVEQERHYLKAQCCHTLRLLEGLHLIFDREAADAAQVIKVMKDLIDEMKKHYGA